MPDVTTWNCDISLKVSEKYLTSSSNEKLAACSEHGKLGDHLISEGKFATVLVLENRNPEKHVESDNVDFDNGDNTTICHLETLLSDKQIFLQVSPHLKFLFCFA